MIVRAFVFLFIVAAFAKADPLALGTFTVTNLGTRTVLAAPHGGFDLATEKLVAHMAENIKWSSVIAFGFRTRSHPLNVNRPTEGIGLPSDKEIHSHDAMTLYTAYKEKVFALASPPTLYVEIHGEGKLANRIEIATKGVSVDQAKRLKAILQPALGDKYLVAIEGVDEIHFQGGGVKKFGIFKEVPIALQIELPWELRMDQPALAESALEEFLPKAAAILQ